ncbi:hypothetical protein LIER_23134 [Lithospermum erythrorhizon]|uniref:Uncharacterized protein n=1 Tax=Lithospermum erythrorhizon TaxID=34254 RepID=A0AAV3QZR5_LITER
MSGNNVENNNETHIPSLNNQPDEQDIPQYPTDIETEIQRRVNERWERERENTIQSSHYTHYSRDRVVSESNEAPSAQNNPHERRPAVPMAVPATQNDDTTQKLQKELQDMKEMIKALISIATSRRECKIKISFTDRLDAVPLPKGVVLSQIT